VPFPDEIRPVEVVPHRDEWMAEYDLLADELRDLELAPMGMIEHVGSTSVPGLAAKDVIDVQIRVPTINEEAFVARFAEIGFRRRPEEWNNIEATRTGPVPKLVFARPAGARHANIHVRTDGSAGARDTVLFRDFLRSQPSMRQAWSDFKVAVVRAVPKIDLASYGQIKQPAWHVLMYAADAWAAKTSWSPEAIVHWSEGPTGSRPSSRT
jgi:GrpB-like predicted nucleotidyltransferase (UPF0157 family)